MNYLSVHVRNAEHDHSAAVVVVEINSFGDFSTGNREQQCAAPTVACLKIRQNYAGSIYKVLILQTARYLLRAIAVSCAS